MRFNTAICFPSIVLLILSSLPGSYTRNIWPRQDLTADNNLPTLTSADASIPSDGSASTDGNSPADASTATDGNTLTDASTATTLTDAGPATTLTDAGPATSTSASASASASPESTSDSASEHTVTTTSSSVRSSSTLASSSSSLTSASPTTSAANATATASQREEHPLPLKPRITPALGIAGVILILTGIIHALIGVKNQWVHTLLSTGYLASLSVTVLILYVMTPPISDAVQGGYLVGIVMTGLIFGAGALIFKELTEGLGCLLGGFCLSMWLLTLTPGGLIANLTGKRIFIGCFCLIFWSLSFSHLTRVYGLIASIAFSGATAMVLGIDCYSRAGLKEFWVYIWGLNSDIFPLGTSTYPITRGIRVESIVILLITIIGVMSQIRLWKIVRDKQNKREEAKMEEQRRKEAVEQALGRHLERHNDKDRAAWERQYGDNAPPKRNNILWTEAHSEKGYAHLSSSDMQTSSPRAPSESVEMTSVAAAKHSSKPKRNVNVAEDTILEEQEEGHESASKSVYSPIPTQDCSEEKSSSDSLKGAKQEPETLVHPLKAADCAKSDALSSKGAEDRSGESEGTERAAKRLSIHSLLSRSSPRIGLTSESQETLVRPTSVHSRPSSIAATLDQDEGTDLDPSPASRASLDSNAPKIALSPEDGKGHGQISGMSSGARQPSPCPSPLFDNLDDFDDPEELTRAPTKASEAPLIPPSKEPELPSEGKAQQQSDAQSLNLTVSKTTTSDALTPDALSHLPSRVSNVVTSYRTNEWAKHIGAADAPIFEEPETIKAIDAEPPTQLGQASPTLSATAGNSDALPALITSTVASGNVISNADQIQGSTSEAQEQVSEQQAEDGVLATAVSPTTASLRIATQPEAPLDGVNVPIQRPTLSPNQAVPSKPKWIAPNSTSRPGFTTSPIAEGIPASFTPGPGLPGKASAGVLKHASSASSLGSYANSGARISAAPQGHTVSRVYSSTNLNDPKRVVPGAPYGMLGQVSAALRSETRLGSYDSRQPQQTTGAEASRRQTLLAAEWRMSQQQDAAVSGMPLYQVDSRRAQMLLDKEQKKAMEGQQRIVQQQQQFAIDQLSRRPDMQEAHREAMRKMQAKTKAQKNKGKPSRSSALVQKVLHSKQQRRVQALQLSKDDPEPAILEDETHQPPDSAAAAHHQSTPPMLAPGPVRVLVASIGNPGRYAATRHSAGHILNKLLAAHLGLPVFQKSKPYSGSIACGSDVGRPELTLWQSGHMMNESGIGLLKAWRAFSSPSSSSDSILGLVVLHDELETAPGVLKVRRGPDGSARGHNGIKSVIGSLRGAGVLPELGDRFVRVGVGIGRPLSRERGDVSTYVLSPVTKGEKDGIEARVAEVDRLLQAEIMRISSGSG
ncbi:hypothetical protein DV735_g4691, partial [Chaetothyriales sp. CBS 134920]